MIVGAVYVKDTDPSMTDTNVLIQ